MARRPIASIAFFLAGACCGPLEAAGSGGPASGPTAAGDSAGMLERLLGFEAEGIDLPIRLLLLVTVLGVVPSIVLLATAFPRIVIVLSFLRRGFGVQDLPPNSVLFGLSFLLAALVMAPVVREIHDTAYVPLKEKRIERVEEAAARAEKPLKRFLLAHTYREDLRFFAALSQKRGDRSRESVQRVEDLSLWVVLPAFVLSELKTAFRMGFLLFLPFLLIDLVVSAVLTSAGMLLVPPAVVSLPLKVLVFVLADGWSVVVGQLALSFAGGP